MSEDNVTYSNSTSRPNSIQEFALAGLLSVVIVATVIGNTLVILAVLTTRRLRTVTNCFVMSLAVADWLVGIFVMPPAVAYRIMGSWPLSSNLCEVWIYLDILLCTASILSLCAISVDRYLAVTRPLSYSRKRRSKRLAFSMILAVWIISALITCPPMLGWHKQLVNGSENEKGKDDEIECGYKEDVGYVIFSAMGSFFIPMVVMLYVYVRISCVVAQRHDQLSNIEGKTRKSQRLVLHTRDESDIDRGSSDCEEHIRCTRYISGQLTACGNSAEPVNQNDVRKPNHTRSLRSNLNYSFTIDHPSPKRTTSFYKSSTMPKEPLHIDVSILNYEPASRVSSFRRETKTAKTLSIVMGGFIACWLPFFVFYLLNPFVPKNDFTKTIMSYLTWLGWINSAINPFIYAFYAPDFRIAFWRLTFKHFSRDRRADLAFQHK